MVIMPCPPPLASRVTTPLTPVAKGTSTLSVPCSATIAGNKEEQILKELRKKEAPYFATAVVPGRPNQTHVSYGYLKLSMSRGQRLLEGQ